MISITRKSPFSGKVHTMEVPATALDLELWKAGMPIQMVFPHMDASLREFIMTGITPEEWDNAFGTNPGQSAQQGDGEYDEGDDESPVDGPNQEADDNE